MKYGKKFHPVKKYAVDLAEMTPANKEKYLPSGRKWYLKLEGSYRDFLEKDAEVAVAKDDNAKKEEPKIDGKKETAPESPVVKIDMDGISDRISS